MKFWKLGMALSLTAVFGLMGCEDSSSSTSNGGGEYKPGTVGCTVTSQDNVYTQETRMDDFSVTMTVKRTDDGTVEENFVFSEDVPADTCDYYSNKIGTDYVDVTCKGKTVKTESKDKIKPEKFSDLIKVYAEICKEANGTPIPDAVKNDEIDLTKVGKCDSTGKKFEIEGTGVSLVCDGEFWKPAKVACTKEGEEKDFGTVELVCKDKKWTFETEEDCSKTMKKTETFLELVKFEATCVDGAWQLDLYDGKAAPKQESEEGEGEGEAEK